MQQWRHFLAYIRRSLRPRSPCAIGGQLKGCRWQSKIICCGALRRRLHRVPWSGRSESAAEFPDKCWPGLRPAFLESARWRSYQQALNLRQNRHFRTRKCKAQAKPCAPAAKIPAARSSRRPVKNKYPVTGPECELNEKPLVVVKYATAMGGCINSICRGAKPVQKFL